MDRPSRDDLPARRARRGLVLPLVLEVALIAAPLLAGCGDDDAPTPVDARSDAGSDAPPI